MNKILALILVSTLCGCTTLYNSETPTDKCKQNTPAINKAETNDTNTKKENKEAKEEYTHIISVDGITVCDTLPKKFCLLTPKGKKTNILYEHLTKALTQHLTELGYAEVENSKAEIFIVTNYAHNSHEGLISIVAYDAKSARNANKNKTNNQEEFTGYKVLARTAISYVSTDKVPFREYYPEVLNTAKNDLLTDLVKPKQYKKNSRCQK